MDTQQQQQTQTPRRRAARNKPNATDGPMSPTPAKPQTPVSQQHQQPSRSKGHGGPNHNRGQNNSNNNNARHTPRPEKRAAAPPVSAAPHVPTTDRSTPKASPANIHQAPPASDEGLFAGHTFGQSPLASALPIPAFFLKERASPQAPEPLVPMLGAETDSQVSSDPSSESDEDAHESDFTSPTTTTTPARSNAARLVECEASPLQIFFDAQRRERERASSNHSAEPRPPFGPPTLSPAPTEPSTVPARPRPSLNGHHHLSPPSHIKSVGISAQELDGTPGSDVSLPFVTSFKQRIARVRPDFASHPVEASTPPTRRANELKQALFGSPTPTTARENSPGRPVAGAPYFGARSAPYASTPERLDWQSIYGNQSPRSPEVVHLERQLLTMLNVTPT